MDVEVWHGSRPRRARVVSARDDKPITGLSLAVTRDDGVVAVEGTGLCYTFVAARSTR